MPPGRRRRVDTVLHGIENQDRFLSGFIYLYQTECFTADRNIWGQLSYVDVEHI